MKNSFTRPSSIALALAFFVCTFSSCLKNDKYEEVPAAGVAFIHASPKTGKMDFVNYDNNFLWSRLSYNTSAVYPASDTSTTPYRALLPGYRTVAIALAGSPYFLSIEQLPFRPDKVYSVFAVDTANKTSLLQVEDSLKSPDESKAFVRFINLSPDSKKLELLLGTVKAPFTAAKAFKEYSGYSLAEPATYTLTIRETENPAVSVKRENVSFVKGGVYTVWARGLEKSTDTTGLNISVMKTNPTIQTK